MSIFIIILIFFFLVIFISSQCIDIIIKESRQLKNIISERISLLFILPSTIWWF